MYFISIISFYTKFYIYFLNYYREPPVVKYTDMFLTTTFELFRQDVNITNTTEAYLTYFFYKQMLQNSLKKMRKYDLNYLFFLFRPMNLITIKKNIEKGIVRTTSEFQRDMMLMFTNAIMYNNSDHDIYKMAETMYNDSMTHLEVSTNFQELFLDLILPKFRFF